MGGTLPFTLAQFVAVFAAYNEALWPAPLVAYALGIAAVLAVAYLQRHADARANALVVLVLALMWAWTGVAYHWLSFSVINPAASAFGALFVVQAVLLIWSGFVRGGLRFAHASVIDAATGAFFVIYAMALYPLIGVWTGHAYPAAPVFGITPCPVTIFTFGLLLLTKGRVPWPVVVLPSVWSVIGGSAAVLLGVLQDWMLPLSALATILLLARRRYDQAASPSQPSAIK